LDFSGPLETHFAMREYLYGNSKSIRGWKGKLDEIFRLDPMDFPFFFDNTVTVERNAILYIGSTKPVPQAAEQFGVSDFTQSRSPARTWLVGVLCMHQL
jgi:hypothetical protein